MIVLPDATATATTWLRTQTPVTTIFGSRIYVRLPDKDVWPAIRIDPIGGDPIREYRIDEANLQFNIFAAGQHRELDAMTYARTVRAALVAMGGYQIVGQVVVIDVTTSSPQLQPDEDRTPPVAHATFSASVAVRPDP